MNKQEKVVCQGVNFIIRDFNECHEDQDNGFTYHVPFILSADEMSVSCARSAIIDDIESGENWEIVREDIGFITNKNRFVDPVEARNIAVEARQVVMIRLMTDPPKIAPLKPEDLY